MLNTLYLLFHLMPPETLRRYFYCPLYEMRKQIYWNLDHEHLSACASNFRPFTGRTLRIQVHMCIFSPIEY